MPHKNSQVKPPANEYALFIGIRAEAFRPDELPPGMTVEELAVQIERSQAAIEAAGVDGVLCLIGTDADEVEAELRRRFAERPAGIAVIGGGIRMLPQNTVLFERIVNVLIDLQPGIRLAFNTGPETSLEAIRRWTDR
jgi:hypothetical protein